VASVILPGLWGRQRRDVRRAGVTGESDRRRHHHVLGHIRAPCLRRPSLLQPMTVDCPHVVSRRGCPVLGVKGEKS